MTYEKLVNPVEFMRSEEPMTLDGLPGGTDDLRPEVSLMIAKARHAGRRHHFSNDPSACLVPEDICREVLSRDWSLAAVDREIVTLADGYSRV